MSKCLIVSVSLSLGLWCGPALGESRTWTSADGRTITAELISHDSATGKVTIRRSNGKTYTLELEKLSEEDQQWLKEEEERLAAEKAEKNKLAGTTVSLASDGKLATKYHVYYPGNYDADTEHPLLILFDPGGNGMSMVKGVRSACDAHGIIAVGCDTFKNGGPYDELVKRFEELLPHIEKNVPHDDKALYMGGFSGGALRAYDYSGRFDRDWQGILAFGGWLGPGDMLKTARNMRVAIVNGEKDKGANQYTERDEKLLEKRGCEVKVFTFAGGHSVASPPVVEEALGWVVEK